ncbi:MAG TPA: serine hydrolase domain-containing protein [Bryobacteraceae bacterium]|nr:serine hydrolase domain-containing protein [Bryobacteraceae bacterium]
MRFVRLAVVFAIASLAAAQVHHARYVPGDAEIHSILEQRIDGKHQSVGIVVGVIDRGGRRVVSYGNLDRGDPRPLNGDTIFEIGSLTKVFTALLLTEMAQHGEVALTDPLSKYLPVRSSITLQDLATNSSGLPRTPANLPKDRANPFAGYTRQMLLASLPAGVSPHWEYSNLGYAILGQAVAPDYERAIIARIAVPLAMSSTRITLASEEKARLAAGHDDHLAPARLSDFGALAPAAGLRSSANDLLKFLSAFLGYTKTPLAPAMAAMLDVREPTTQPGLVNALGWQISTPDALEIVWKDGATAGFTSFLGCNPRAGVGVVVLSNASTSRGVNDIGMHILDAGSPLFRVE